MVKHWMAFHAYLAHKIDGSPAPDTAVRHNWATIRIICVIKSECGHLDDFVKLTTGSSSLLSVSARYPPTNMNLRKTNECKFLCIAVNKETTKKASYYLRWDSLRFEAVQYFAAIFSPRCICFCEVWRHQRTWHHWFHKKEFCQCFALRVNRGKCNYNDPQNHFTFRSRNTCCLRRIDQRFQVSRT